MLDIEFIRENRKLVEKSIEARGVEIDIDSLLEYDDQRREAILALETAQAEQNKMVKAVQGKPGDEQLKKMSELKKTILSHENELNTIVAQYDSLLKEFPNVISDDTPIGPDESANKPIRSWGDKPKFDFEIKDHEELALLHNLLDKERATKLSGSRFVFLKGALVELELALTQFVFDTLTSEQILKTIIDDNNLDVSTKPFELVSVPEIVDAEIFRKMGRYEPKEDKYHINVDENEQMLIGSAEHALGAMFMDEIIDVSDRPIRLVSVSSAFRREAGTYGKDTKGLIRLHQFKKIEMESFTSADLEVGLAEQDFLVAIQEYFMQQLELPYQVVAISSGDMGGPDYRQIDIEAWLPAQKTYRETHTSDFMTDFQARKLNTRYRDGDENNPVFMNDATAMAMPRMFAAILENNQQADGTVRIPAALKPYLKREVIG